jgi:hypothetical protein
MAGVFCTGFMELFCDPGSGKQALTFTKYALNMLYPGLIPGICRVHPWRSDPGCPIPARSILSF